MPTSKEIACVLVKHIECLVENGELSVEDLHLIEKGCRDVEFEFKEKFMKNFSNIIELTP